MPKNDKLFYSHDSIFKWTFSNVENVKTLIKGFLPPKIANNINYNELELLDISLVDEELKQYQADLIYETRYKNYPAYIYILFEHKSYLDRYTPLQLLKYMLKLWEREIKERERKVPVIIPVVYYHGEERWRYWGGIKELMWEVVRDELEEYIPRYRYEVVDLGRYREEEIEGRARGMVAVGAVMILMRSVMRGSEEEIERGIRRVMRMIKEVEEAGRGIEILRVAIRYILGTIDIEAEKIREIIEGEIEGGGEELMSIAQRLIQEGYEKGKREGLQQGIQQGIIEKTKQAIIDVLEARFETVPLRIVKEINKIDEIEVLDRLHRKAVLVKDIKEFEEILKKIFE